MEQQAAALFTSSLSHLGNSYFLTGQIQDYTSHIHEFQQGDLSLTQLNIC